MFERKLISLGDRSNVIFLPSEIRRPSSNPLHPTRKSLAADAHCTSCATAGAFHAVQQINAAATKSRETNSKFGEFVSSATHLYYDAGLI